MIGNVKFQPLMCAICEQPGATRRWHKQSSYFAHPICLRWIQNEIQILEEMLDSHFPEEGFYRNLAQSTALCKLKEKIGNDSILTYKQKGMDLSELIRSQEVTNSIAKSRFATRGKIYMQKRNLSVPVPPISN